MIDLRVHVRRVVGADGTVTSENEVYCLRRQQSLPVAECEECIDYRGASVDLRRHRNFIACAGVTESCARALGPSRRPTLMRRGTSRSSPASATAIGDVMTADVWCVRPESSLADVARLFEERRIGCTPVVDEHGRPVGIISARDLLRAHDADRVAQKMSALIFTIPDNASLSEAAALMALERIHHLIVVTDDGKVAGIVSSLDLMGWLAREDGYVVA